MIVVAWVMRAATAALVVTDGQRRILEKLAGSQSVSHREVVRAKALLLAVNGVASTAIGAQLGVSPSSVVDWRATFVAEGMKRFGQVHAGRGRKASIPADKIDEIVRLTQDSKPDGETHWSCRSMAKAAGVSPATVQRVWSSRGLKPHLVKTTGGGRAYASASSGPLKRTPGPDAMTQNMLVSGGVHGTGVAEDGSVGGLLLRRLGERRLRRGDERDGLNKELRPAASVWLRDGNPFTKHLTGRCERLADALGDEFVDAVAWEFHDHSGALVVDKAEELARNTGTSAAHDGAFLDTLVVFAELIDEIPEQ